MTFRFVARLLAPLLGVAALGGACQDQIVRFGEKDGGPPSSSGPGMGGAGGGPSSIADVGGNTTIPPTSGAAGGVTTTKGGAGGGMTCSPGYESFQMEIDRYDGSAIGCKVTPFAEVGPLDILGTVLESDETTLVIDECPPGTGCPDTQKTTITFSADGLVAPLVPIGYFVDVEVDVSLSLGLCAERLQITNLPIWNGVEGPGGSELTLWLSANDGRPDPFADAPFTVVPKALGCGPDGIDAFWLQFVLLSEPSMYIDVHQGELVLWPVDAFPSSAVWQVRNLRSYQTGNTNDTHNWAYWLTPTVVQPQ